MKVDIKELKKGDTVYWNRGGAFYTGEYVQHLTDILDLKAILVKTTDGSNDEILDVFLITKDEFDLKKDTKKGVRTKMEKATKDVVLKPNLKGLETLLAKEGKKITRADKWYRFRIQENDQVTVLEYHKAVKDLYAAYAQGGMESLLALNEVGK